MAAKKATRKPSAQPTETRDQKFVRLAVKRVNKVINDVRLVSNLATYPHTPEQASSIVNAINEAVDTMSQRLAGTKVSREAFKL